MKRRVWIWEEASTGPGEDQWMWLYENVNLVYQKGHQQSKKLNDNLWENMCNTYNKGLKQNIFGVYKKDKYPK